MTNEHYLLYLEDDPIELLKFEMAFEKLDIKIPIKSFENGALGWNFLENHLNNLPKIIILDLKMPVMSGLEFLKKIKNHLHFRKIPVIVLSSSEDKNDILFSYENQVAGYFVKPFDNAEYDVIIQRINEYWSTSKVSI